MNVVYGARSRVLRLTLVAALLVASTSLQAQGSSTAASLPQEGAAGGALSHQRTVELWGGLARHSPRWGLLGASPQMNLGMVAVRFAQVVGAPAFLGSGTHVEYTFDVLPVVILSLPFRSARGTGAPCPNADLCVFPHADQSGRLFPNGSALGFGINPAGLTARFRPDRNVSPTVGFAVGALYFDRSVPTTRATRFNFTASGEAGVRLGPPDGRGVTVTYRFHHLSNAGTSEENPGVASHLVTLGFRFPRPPRSS